LQCARCPARPRSRSAPCNSREPVTSSAPTWPPQSAQQNWSHRRGRGNFIKAWGGSSPCGPGRVMPKLNGARYEGIQRNPRDATAHSSTSNVIHVCRIELGPTRRDPRGHSLYERNEQVRINTVRCSRPQDEKKSALQGASATGGSAVTRRARRADAVARVTAERQPSGVMPRSTTFEFGVSVLARMAHVNRACAESMFMDDAYAHNHRREHQTRRCTLQNGLPAKSSAAHGVHG
jgi:hypothetical protein